MTKRKNAATCTRNINAVTRVGFVSEFLALVGAPMKNGLAVQKAFPVMRSV
jgi:hypothetical protein